MREWEDKIRVGTGGWSDRGEVEETEKERRQEEEGGTSNSFSDF